MRRATSMLLAVLVFCALAGCGKKEQSAASSPNPAPRGSPDWCASGGMEAAKDPACKQKADRDLNKFLGKGGGS